MIKQWTAEDILNERLKNWPEAVTATSQLILRIFRASGLILDNARSQVLASGLTFTEFEVLAALRSAAPPRAMFPTELYKALLISSGGLTKVLHALEENGLIRRASHEEDRRSKPVQLTRKGCTLIERTMLAVLRSDQRLIAKGLSEADTDRLILLLRKLLSGLEPDEPRSRAHGPR